VNPEEEKGKAAVERIYRKEDFKPGMKEWVGDGMCKAFNYRILYGRHTANIYSYYYYYSITPSLFHSRLRKFLFLQILPTVAFLFFFRSDSADSLRTFTAQCYACAVYAMALCPYLSLSVCVCHKSVFY